MSDLLPVVSLAGPPELHRRAQRYNADLARLAAEEDYLRSARHWNSRERFGSGMFSRTMPPIPTHVTQYNIDVLRDMLRDERAAIVEAAKGSAKP